MGELDLAKASVEPLALLDALEDGVCVVDAEWRVTAWNAAAARLFGLERREALGRELLELLPWLRGSSAWARLLAARRDAVPIRLLDRGRPSREGFLSIHAAPLEPAGMVLQVRDATADLERAEQSTRLLESIRDGFIAVDRHWNILYLNAVAESLLRFPRDQAVGTSLWSLLPHDPPEIRESLRSAMTDRIQRHLRDVRPEGRVFQGRVFDLWVFPLDGGGMSILFEEVSERVLREGELARLATEAQEANRAKSRFFAAISHELRTPLNAIIGYTHLLSTETYGSMPAGARRASDRAGICAEHLSRLVDDVLLLTTAEIGRLPVVPVPVDLEHFLPPVLEPHRHQAEAKGLGFRVELQPELPRVETDPQRLRQLLAALLSNAVKFTSRGEVAIEIGLRMDDPASEPVSAIFPLFPEARLEIAVSDTGPGIDPVDRERIFGPFEQGGDPSRSESMMRGTGLGLTIARQLSNLLGGKLYLAESSPAGSRFCVRLPTSLPPPTD